jgi:hypothetical protein
MKQPCARCGTVRSKKFMRELYTADLSIYEINMKPTGVYICSSPNTCKKRRKAEMKADS